MRNLQDIDFSRLDYAALGNRERALVLRRAMERAHVERSQALWRMIAALAVGLRRMAAAAVQWHADYRQRRRRQSEAATLNALSDRTLKDIGVARCEIDRLVVSGRRAA